MIVFFGGVQLNVVFHPYFHLFIGVGDDLSFFQRSSFPYDWTCCLLNYVVHAPDMSGSDDILDREPSEF